MSFDLPTIMRLRLQNNLWYLSEESWKRLIIFKKITNTFAGGDILRYLFIACRIFTTESQRHSLKHISSIFQISASAISVLENASWWKEFLEGREKSEWSKVDSEGLGIWYRKVSFKTRDKVGFWSEVFSLTWYIVIFMRFHTLRDPSSHLASAIANVLFQLSRKCLWLSLLPLAYYYIHVYASLLSCSVYWAPINHEASRSNTPNDCPEAALCLFLSFHIGNETMFAVFYFSDFCEAGYHHCLSFLYWSQ